MTHKSIGYHTRICGGDTKASGGSFGGSIDAETVERLVNANFSVVVKNSGRAVFVDRHNREVRCYISVDPETTQKGIEALAADRKRREELSRIEERQEEERQEAIDELTAGLTTEQIKALKGKHEK